MADRDILFAVKNNFYLGAYNNAINEASDLEGLTEAEQLEKDAFVYRSYICLGSYDVRPSLRTTRKPLAAASADHNHVPCSLLSAKLQTQQRWAF
jgi:coatomer protein complex subunit epsilon